MTLAYTVDRTENNRVRQMEDLPEWARTKWHRARPDDEGLAACSRRIILNTEDATDIDLLHPRDLCGRCFR